MQELGQLIGYLVRNIFMEKLYRKSALITSAIYIFPHPLFFLLLAITREDDKVKS